MGVIDTGVHYNHPDLSDDMWRNPGGIADNGLDDDDGDGYAGDVYGQHLVGANDSNLIDDHGHG